VRRAPILISRAIALFLRENPICTVRFDQILQPQVVIQRLIQQLILNNPSHYSVSDNVSINIDQEVQVRLYSVYRRSVRDVVEGDMEGRHNHVPEPRGKELQAEQSGCTGYWQTGGSFRIPIPRDCIG
jgi:hypothetical protein